MYRSRSRRKFREYGYYHGDYPVLSERSSLISARLAASSDYPDYEEAVNSDKSRAQERNGGHFASASG